MEDNRLEITRAQWKGWIDLITRAGDGIVDQLNSAAEDIMRASEHQTEAKWGTLPGPAAFGSTYKKYLDAEHAALLQMAINAQSVAGHLQDALDEIAGRDTVSASELDAVISGLDSKLTAIDSVYESEAMKKHWKDNPGDDISAHRNMPML
jgi:hypothetical protein